MRIRQTVFWHSIAGLGLVCMFQISYGQEAGNGNVDAIWEKLRSAPERNTAVEDLIIEAEKLRADRQLREAEILLTRAIQMDANNLKVWRALAAVQREMAEVSLSSEKFLIAAQEVDRAKTSVNAMKSLSINPILKGINPKIPFDEEKANDTVAEKVRQGIDNACGQFIGNAIKLADDAYHNPLNVLALGFRTVRNDRKKVVEGLICLKPVFQIGPWASEVTRRNTNDAYSKLKALVDKDEWNDLLARAGFDPESREALRKGGLE